MQQALDLRSRESILVVGDTPANRTLARLLAENGYQVRFASSVDAAMQAIQTQVPDLILLCKQLADDDDGMRQQLKADQRTFHIPIVVSGLKSALNHIDTEALLEVETQLVSGRQQAQRQQQIELQQESIQQESIQQESIQRQRAEQALEQQLQKTRLLQQVTEVICSQTESQQILKTVVEQIGRVLQVSRCSIHIYVPPPIPEILLVAEYVEPGLASIGSIDLALEDELFIPQVLTQNRAVVSVDTASDARLECIQALCQIAQIQSLVAVRTSYKNRVNGMLSLQQCDRQRDWAADEIALIETLAAQVGIVLAQAKSIEQEQKQLEAFGYQNLLLRQEICERRQIELALQDSEAELRSLFAAMMDVVLVLDRQGRYLKIAPTNPENLYRPADNLLGKTLHEVFPQNQADQFLGYIQASLETQQSIDCEYCLTIQGQDVWFSAKISPNSQDTVLWVARDINARKQAETQLWQKSATLSEFSTNLKQLHRLSLTDFETIEALCADYLKTGCDVLGFSWGMVGQCVQEGCRLLAVHANQPTVDAQVNSLASNLETMKPNIYWGEVLQRKQTVCYAHVNQIAEMQQHPVYQSLKLESYIGTPVWVDGDMYGVLSFFSTQARSGFDHHEQEMIELMAQSIGKFISTHRVKAKRQQAEEELQLLLNVTQAITAAPDFNQALYAALQTLCEATGWVYGEVWLPSADGQVLECSPVWYCNSAEHSPTVIASVQQFRQSVANVTFQPNEGIAGRVWSQQQPEWTLEDLADTALASASSQYQWQLVKPYGIKARLGVPITVTPERNMAAQATSAFVNLADQGASQSANGSTVLAVLVFFTAEARPQEQRLIQLVSAVAAQLGTVLAHKQAEAELKALFTAMDDVVLVRDKAGRCLKVASANPKAYQSVAHLLGKTLHETLPQPIADRILQGICSSLATDTTVHLEYTLPLPQEVCLSASISPLSDESVLIVARDISDRKQIEEALARRERHLATLVEVQQELLAFREQQTRYTKILGLLGQMASASRVYLYENWPDPSGTLLVMQKAVWCTEDRSNQSVVLPTHFYQEGGARWQERLANGEIISGTTADFSQPERRLLEAQGILSILVFPLLVNGEFWGFVGFDHCAQARTWDSLEMSLLNAAVAAIALHYERKLAENALRQSAEREQATLRVIERMRQTLEIEQIFRTTAEELRQLLQCDRVLIYRFNSDWSGEFVAESVAENWDAVLQTVDQTSDLTATATQGDHCIVKTWINAGLVQDTYLQETQGGAYSQGAKYLCVRDVHQINFSECYLNLLNKLQAKAYLTVPILRNNRLWGLLASYQNSGPREWQPSEINLVTHISTQFGVALQQADLLAETQRQSADLEKAKDAAEAANRAKTQFLANMSHELRTPLNSILGFTQLVYQEAELSSEHQGYLNIIKRSGQHLLELINDVLEVAKLEANRTTLQESLFDLRALLDNIEEMLRLTALEKQLELHIVVAPEVPQYVIADKSKLRQVLLNLLDNAIKFTQIGHVSLHVCLSDLQIRESEPLAAPRLTQHQSADSASAELLNSTSPNVYSSHLWLHFAVADTGFGIAAEEMDCLFEAFVQTEAGRQSNRGTGLGLVISRRFVDLLGGKLQVQSILGAGSVFEFTIPVQLTPQDAPLPVTLGLEAESTAESVEGSCLHEASELVFSSQLSASDLAAMSPEWLANLYRAASGCSDRQVLQLIEQIPATQSQVAKGLAELVYNFRFEEILELINIQFQ